MKHVRIFLKGWPTVGLYVDAVNDSSHELHAEACKVHMRSFRPYEKGDAVYLAAEYDVLDSVADLTVCAAAYERFNIGTDDIAAQYRRDGHRSLSVGDVVEVAGTAYTCASFGWDLVPEFPGE